MVHVNHLGPADHRQVFAKTRRHWDRTVGRYAELLDIGEKDAAEIGVVGLDEARDRKTAVHIVIVIKRGQLRCADQSM